MHIMYIGLEYMWWRRPRKYLKVLYCTVKISDAQKNLGRVKISDGFIFRHFFSPKLKSS